MCVCVCASVCVGACGCVCVCVCVCLGVGVWRFAWCRGSFRKYMVNRSGEGRAYLCCLSMYLPIFAVCIHMLKDMRVLKVCTAEKISSKIFGKQKWEQRCFLFIFERISMQKQQFGTSHGGKSRNLAPRETR